MSESIKVRFKNTEEEYCKAIRTYYSRKLKTRVDIVLGTGGIFAGIILGWLYGYSSSIVFLIGVGAFFLFMLFFLNFVVPKIQFRQQPKYRDEYELSFSDIGIDFRADHLNSTLDWTYYTKVLETKEFFLLLYGKNLFSIVPKRAFINNEDENKFKQLMAKNFPKSYEIIS